MEVQSSTPGTFSIRLSEQSAAGVPTLTAFRRASPFVSGKVRPGGPLHWLCTSATEEKLFSVIAVDDEATYAEWVKKTNAYMREARAGANPCAAKQRARQVQRAAESDTLENIAAEYLRREGPRLRTLSQRRSDLDLICASVLGRLPVAEITRGQYTTRHALGFRVAAGPRRPPHQHCGAGAHQGAFR